MFAHCRVLADPFASVRVPRTAFLHQALRHTEINQIARVGDSLSVKNIDFHFANGAATLFLTTLILVRFPDHGIAILDWRRSAGLRCAPKNRISTPPASGCFRMPNTTPIFSRT